jgi:putative Holliday junction resolvase
VAGVDYGTVRIGVAVSDPSRTFSSPHENYTRQDIERDAAYFQRLVESEGIVLFVVGLPIHLDGRESQKSTEARAFAKWLTAQTGVMTALFDERFTSAQAEQMLTTANLTKKKRKRRMDMLAAQILLAAFLDAGCPMDADGNHGLEDR